MKLELETEVARLSDVRIVYNFSKYIYIGS